LKGDKIVGGKSATRIGTWTITDVKIRSRKNGRYRGETPDDATGKMIGSVKGG